MHDHFLTNMQHVVSRLVLSFGTATLSVADRQSGGVVVRVSWNKDGIEGVTHPTGWEVLAARILHDLQRTGTITEDEAQDGIGWLWEQARRNTDDKWEEARTVGATEKDPTRAYNLAYFTAGEAHEWEKKSREIAQYITEWHPIKEDT